MSKLLTNIYIYTVARVCELWSKGGILNKTITLNIPRDVIC